MGFEGGLRAAFFALCLALCAWLTPGTSRAAAEPSNALPELRVRAVDRALERDPVWAALLHVGAGRPNVVDPGFLLSAGRFSLRQEMLDTLDALYGPRSAEAVCRFPARYAWLRDALDAPALSLDHCADLQEFLRRAPADEISLVFASENLAQPSSMMGHLFLKLGGQDQSGQRREHAISFFTDVATLNLPKLLVDSLVVGKQGHFALSPYAGEVNLYVHEEQRTLWEYELRLDDRRRTLLRYHLLELKQSAFTYFFHQYNCATLVKHLLAIAAPQVLEVPAWATTPKDVIKLADQAGVIAGTKVHAPPRWRIRAIDPVLGHVAAKSVKDSVQARQVQALPGPHPSPQGYLSVEMASAYNQYLSDRGERDRATWQSYRDALEALNAVHYRDHEVHAGSAKDPLRSPQDSQYRVGARSFQGRHHLTVGVLPVSHTLADDNGQYFGESELRLFDLEVMLDVASNVLRLHHFTVYAAKSILPRDTFTGGLSGEFRVGVEPQFGEDLQDRLALLTEGAVGVAGRPMADVDLYVLMGAGLGWRHHPYLYIKPTIGAVVREVYDMKTQVSLSYTGNALGRGEGVAEAKVTQSKFLGPSVTLVLEASRRLSTRQGDHAVAFTVKRIF